MPLSLLTSTASSAGPDALRTAEATDPIGLLAQLGHQLRTPLNAILGFSQLIRQRDPTGLDMGLSAADCALRIETAGLELMALLEDLLLLARLDSGQDQLSLEPLPIQIELAGLVAALQPELTRRGVLAEITVPDGLSLPLDGRVLRRILLHLTVCLLEPASPQAPALILSLTAATRPPAPSLCLRLEGQSGSPAPAVSPLTQPRLSLARLLAERAGWKVQQEPGRITLRFGS